MLYLVHHADALGPEIDPQQPLSIAGRLHAAHLAASASARGMRPTIIWHSGKLRARQTADAFRTAAHPSAVLSAIRGLQPADPPDWIRDRLIGETREIAIVGHFPSLPRLLHLLVTNANDGAMIDFPMHGMVALQRSIDQASWVESWRL